MTVVAFVQAFGHHDDIGGAVPGSMPSRATSVFEEGLMVPPIRLWDAGVPNEAALKIMTRNSRMPESLAADLDAECAACLMGARRLAELFDRYGRGRVEAAFEEILRSTTETYRTEILSVIPDGSYVWEDYAEHDGVDEPRLHTQRITLTKASAGDGITDARIVLDFTGTAPQARGPINHCADYADGVFLAKWLAPILRNLAATPGADGAAGRQRGRRAADRDAVPTQGHAAHADRSRRRRTPARSSSCACSGCSPGCWRRRSTAGCPLTRRRSGTPACTAPTTPAEPFLMREVLGGGSGGRYYADGEDTIHVVPDSRNLPTEFSESRFPFLVESLGLAVDSGGPGRYRGGLGYDKQIRMLTDGFVMSIADRSILSCWGVRGGRAGRPFRVTIDPGGPAEREVDAMADAEPVRAGEVVRIRTTGGGGWGDPLDRPARRRAAGRACTARCLRPAPPRTTASSCIPCLTAGRSTSRRPTAAAAAMAAARPERRAVLRPRPRVRAPVRRADIGGRRLPLRSSAQQLVHVAPAPGLAGFERRASPDARSG